MRIGLRAAAPAALLALSLWPAAEARAAQTVVTLSFDDCRSSQLTVLPMLASRGFKASFFINSGRMGTSDHYDWPDALNIQAAGHEIGGHTIDHEDLTSLSDAEAIHQVCDDRTAILAHGLDVRSFAFPYLAVDTTSKNIVRDCGYSAARGHNGIGGSSEPDAEAIPPPDIYDIRVNGSVQSSMSLADLQNLVLAGEAGGGGWVNFTFHQVLSSCSETYCITTSKLDAFLTWLAGRGPGTVVKTLAATFLGPVGPPDNTPPFVNLLAPADGSTAAGNVLLQAESTDDVAVGHVDFLVDGGVVGSDSTAPYQFLWDSTQSDTSPVVVTARAVDTTGNTTTSDGHLLYLANPPRTDIEFGDVWKYRDDNVDPGATWFTLGYDDSAWKSGPGQLGYGEGDEATVLTKTSPSQSSVYFRRKLTLPSVVTAASLDVLFDDGFAVLINGTVVFSRNVGNGLAHTAFASGSADNSLASGAVPLSPNPFVVGENIIAVIVKQSSGSSGDLSFDLHLDTTLGSGTAALHLTQPNGGQTLAPGSTFNIQWQTTGSVPTVDLAYSTNSGATWSPIASAISNTGQFSWTVPAVSTTTALVRVASSSDAAIFDVSDAVFTISSTLHVTQPNGGEVLAPGSTFNILWQTTGSVPNVDLAYSTNSGGTWISIASSVSNTGQFSWTVPAVNTTTALVRVASSSDAAIFDVSDAVFTISNTATTRPIPFGSVWKYYDALSDPGAAWNTLGYNDSAWLSGPGELGYGDGDEATLLTKLSPSQPSYLFRRVINISGTVTAATARVKYDDGFALYVNGVLITSKNIKNLAFNRYGSGSAENAFQDVTIPPGAFVAGNNVIAVMVKQTGRTSPDVSFDLQLDLTTSGP